MKSKLTLAALAALCTLSSPANADFGPEARENLFNPDSRWANHKMPSGDIAEIVDFDNDKIIDAVYIWEVKSSRIKTSYIQGDHRFNCTEGDEASYGATEINNRTSSSEIYSRYILKSSLLPSLKAIDKNDPNDPWYKFPHMQGCGETVNVRDYQIIFDNSRVLHKTPTQTRRSGSTGVVPVGPSLFGGF